MSRWRNAFCRLRAASRLAALVFAMSLLAMCTRSGETGLNPGDSPPKFILPVAGTTELVELSKFKGKLVLMNLWATWCGPCVEEMPALERLYQRLKDNNFVVVAIAVDDSVERIREFQQRFGLSFPILIDESGDIKNEYRTSGVPESFFISADGKLLMVPDPDSGEPTVRIVGPREWDSPNSIHRIEKLLKSAN